MPVKGVQFMADVALMDDHGNELESAKCDIYATCYPPAPGAGIYSWTCEELFALDGNGDPVTLDQDTYDSLRELASERAAKDG